MSTGALRDIKKGEAIMMDYKEFRTEIQYDEEFMEFLQTICDKGIDLVLDAKDGSYVEKQCENTTTCS